MKFSGREKRAKGRVRLFRTRGSAELRKIDSLWLCYAGPLAEKRKSEIASKRGEPAIERRRECTGSGLDLGEREKQVVCHASALALAMTDEARREAKM